jgi:cob(I)alamin adenosyltransferase
MTKRERAMRVGGGYALLSAFSVMSACRHVLATVVREQYKGLEPKEEEWLRKRIKHYNTEAEQLRRFAWRLINDNSTPGGR